MWTGISVVFLLDSASESTLQKMDVDIDICPRFISTIVPKTLLISSNSTLLSAGFATLQCKHTSLCSQNADL